MIFAIWIWRHFIINWLVFQQNKIDSGCQKIFWLRLRSTKRETKTHQLLRPKKASLDSFWKFFRFEFLTRPHKFFYAAFFSLTLTTLCYSEKSLKNLWHGRGWWMCHKYFHNGRLMKVRCVVCGIVENKKNIFRSRRMPNMFTFMRLIHIFYLWFVKGNGRMRTRWTRVKKPF